MKKLFRFKNFDGMVYVTDRVNGYTSSKLLGEVTEEETIFVVVKDTEDPLLSSPVMTEEDYLEEKRCSRFKHPSYVPHYFSTYKEADNFLDTLY